MGKRPFGKTGVELPILSLGCQRLVDETTRDGARRQLEASLDPLQTDHVEEVRLHNVFKFDRLDAMTGNGRTRCQ
jgi:aryl-alcohol dehydrogenase-like predicted oxidoreductase